MKASALSACIMTSIAAAAHPTGVPVISQSDDLQSFVWATADSVIAPDSLLPLFRVEEIAEPTKQRMHGRSYPDGCTVPWTDLRYLFLPHYDGHGNIRIGEMVCNKAIAGDLIQIFRELYLRKYPIERMQLIDNFDADDQVSMAANNTSCFNFRLIDGSRRLSRHALGMAVDINPLYNPYVRTIAGRTVITPAEAAPYADRSRRDTPFKITLSDPAYRLFRAHGFRWGGSWRTRKDYQHFQK